MAIATTAPVAHAADVAAPAVTPPLPVSEASTAAEAGLVDLRDIAPGIDLDLRYAGAGNFTGARVPGYDAAKCWLLAPVADALARVEHDLHERGLRLRIYDCYRPARAVARFVQWIGEPDEALRKAQYYPNLDKAALLGDYIAPVSGHSTGVVIDLTLMRCDSVGGNADGDSDVVGGSDDGRRGDIGRDVDDRDDTGDSCTPLDMGTPFDFFDPLANTDSPQATPTQRANRHRLRDAMQAGGFEPYAHEWWHFRYRLDPPPALRHDVVIR